jgi:2-oxoglutarate ferredoxin oxidoreductase subunit gamma
MMPNPSWKALEGKIFGGKKAQNFRLSGSGGHGLITASVILARAGILEGHNALQAQVYGAEARGSATKAEVVIKDGDIFYPKLVAPDFLLALTPDGITRFSQDMVPNGLVVYDSVLIPDKEPSDKGPYYFGIPMWREILAELGSGVAINIVSLGVVVALTEVVSRKSIEDSVHENFKKEYRANNQKALELGYRLAEEVKRG